MTKEIALKVYLEGEFGDHVYVHIDFYVQETEHISGEFFLLATSETEYRTFSVKGSSLDIRFHPFKNDDPVEVSWCIYLTT